MKTLSLDELKALMQVRVRKEFLSCSLLSVGIPKGAITAISGTGKTEFTLKFMAEHPELPVAWIEEHLSIFPFGFLQRNIQLNRVLFVEAGEEVAWVCLQVLKAQVFPIVVLYTATFELKTLRRLQLLAEKAGAMVLWLMAQPENLWPLSLQLQVQRFEEELDVRILRQRF